MQFPLKNKLKTITLENNWRHNMSRRHGDLTHSFYRGLV